MTFEGNSVMTFEGALGGGAGSHVATMPTPIDVVARCGGAARWQTASRKGTDAAWRRQPRRSLAGTRYLSQ
jgi:hypothetical protein